RLGQSLPALVIAAACGANLLVLCTYYTNLLRNGGTASWTDAMYPAFRAIGEMDKTAVCTVDWGLTDTLRMYAQGFFPICNAGNPLNEPEREVTLFQISQPGYVFLTHSEGNESFPGITGRFVEFAGKHGFQRYDRRVFADANGRQTVETFRFSLAVPLPANRR